MTWPSDTSDLGKDWPCPTLARCVGFQACFFHFGNELCGRDPAPSIRKALLVTLLCESDTPDADSARVGAKEKWKRDLVLHISYRSRLEAEPALDPALRDYGATPLSEYHLPEGEVFGGRCLLLHLAKRRQGYRGECSAPSPSPKDAAHRLWPRLGRTRSRHCRLELIRVFCAFQYNPKGLCVPPDFLEQASESNTNFSFLSLPRIGPHFPSPTSHPTNAHLLPARLGFMILLHKDIPAAMELLRAIWRPQHIYVVHVDRRAVAVYQTLLRLVGREFPAANVVVLEPERSFDTPWASYGIVRAQLECLEELLRRGASWDFAVNLSGADLPLRNIDDLADALTPHRGLNFLPFAQLRNGEHNQDDQDKQQLTREAFHACDNYVFNVTATAGMPHPQELRVYQAPQWGVFSRSFCEFLVDERRRPESINRFQFYLQTHVVPDESYIATLLLNSPFRETLVRYPVHAAKRFTSATTDHLCRHRTEADFCGQGPGSFSKDDEAELMSASHRSFFARKFRTDTLDDVTRAFALGLASGGYSKFADQFLPQLVVKDLAKNVLGSLLPEGYHRTLLGTPSVRLLPSLVARDPCCRSPSISLMRTLTDHDLSMDFHYVVHTDHQDEEKALRVTLEPTTNGRSCFPDGHLRMLFVTPWSGGQGLGLQQTLPIPFGPAGITSVSVAMLISNEQEDDEYAGGEECMAKGIGGDDPIQVGDSLLRLHLRLVSPGGGTRCTRNETILSTNGSNDYPASPSVASSKQLQDQKKNLLTRFYSLIMECGPMEPGLWTLQLRQQDWSSSARLYKAPFFLIDYVDEESLRSQLPETRLLWQLKSVVPLTALHRPDKGHKVGISVLRWCPKNSWTVMTCKGGLSVLFIMVLCLLWLRWKVSARRAIRSKKFVFFCLLFFGMSSLLQMTFLFNCC